MSTISITLPESLHKEAQALAQQENISVSQLIATALAEKVSALMTSEYLEERARRGSREKFERVLAKVRDVEPEEQDKL
jgi:metal-responsive CopG/Arc/MetJ family transcriptional regulator